MANYKSAKKRIKVADRNRRSNMMVKSRVRTAVKKVLRSLEEGSDQIDVLAKHAISQLDKAQSKGILHKNTVARYKSRLMTKVNGAAATN